MNDPQTCGKGLAEHAVLPGKIGELMGSVADNLDLLLLLQRRLEQDRKMLVQMRDAG